uniref:Uncharacterized protein n=1 Tax=Arundo donax TaxID=35708 RepID=A0A0A9HGU8_ARUDO
MAHHCLHILCFSFLQGLFIPRCEQCIFV